MAGIKNRGLGTGLEALFSNSEIDMGKISEETWKKQRKKALLSLTLMILNLMKSSPERILMKQSWMSWQIP